jgi:L-lysine exporter family protein LysE/ArgO
MNAIKSQQLYLCIDKTMVYAFFYGMFTGLLLSIMLGTVFFFLLQNSIENGFKSGMFISTGVIISDIILITLSYFNASLFPSGGKTEMIVRVCGAVLLLVMGINNLRKRKQAVVANANSKNSLVLGSKGFMLNILNPGNYLSWLAVSATLNNVLHFSNTERWLFYGGALCSIFGMEVLISLAASWLKKYISDQFLQRLNLVLGIVFIVFCLVLLKPVIFPK